MNKENKLIPELRFPEFKNEGEWDEKTLIDVCDITNGKANAQDHVENGKYPLFDRSEVIKASDEFIFDSEAVIIPGEGMRFIPKYYEGKFNLHQRAYALKDFKCSGQFVYYSMLHRSALISQKAVQSTVLSLRLPILQKFPLEIPINPKEQEKIASCLSSLDEVISAHSQKLEVLKDHKKGLMQILLPSAGEKVPKYRFKEFENDGDWVEKKLGDIAELTSSKRVHLSDYVSSGVPFFRGKEISQLKTNQFPNDLLYISIEHYKEIKDKYGIPKKGDILITAVGTLGNVYCIKNDDEFYFKDGNLIWMKNISIDSHFLEVLLDVEKEKVLASAIGSSQKALTMAALNKIEFPIPKNPQEQQKIASCLSSLDTLITAQQEKIEQLKLHKKGLMQGLFPKIKE